MSSSLANNAKNLTFQKKIIFGQVRKSAISEVYRPDFNVKSSYPILM